GRGAGALRRRHFARRAGGHGGRAENPAEIRRDQITGTALMEIHKPKPIRNWREFLKEVGTIVLGVCIALAAEQAVEWWHWRGQVQGARQALAQELARNMRNGAARVVMASCVEGRLDKLADVLDAASRGGTLPPLSEALIDTPQMDWPTSTWKGVTS